MSLSPGNKSGDSFNFYLQESIARLEPSFKKYFEAKNRLKMKTQWKHFRSPLLLCVFG